MYLQNIQLQDFKSYDKELFLFHKVTTVIVGPNTSGKTNLIEAVTLLANGKSFKTEKETQLIRFGTLYARVFGMADQDELEVRITEKYENDTPMKRYFINGVPKRRTYFSGHLAIVLFSPADLDIIIGSPSTRREFLDSVIEQIDMEYRIALQQYTKSLRQRNALIEVVQQTGIRNQRQFDYWDSILIESGTIITHKREAFINYINLQKKEVCNLTIAYDKSTISITRLAQYMDAEIG